MTKWIAKEKPEHEKEISSRISVACEADDEGDIYFYWKKDGDGDYYSTYLDPEEVGELIEHLLTMVEESDE